MSPVFAALSLALRAAAPMGRSIHRAEGVTRTRLTRRRFGGGVETVVENPPLGG
jgi:hypothetical protein